MNIKERLVRQDETDKIYIGGVVKRAYNGQFGEVFRAIVEGLKDRQLMDSQDNPKDRAPLSADRILGRLEAYQTIVYELELSIDVAEKLQLPQEEEEED